MFRLFSFWVFLSLLNLSTVFAQTFTGTGGAIPDNGTPVLFNINVSGLPAVIDTSNFGLESVCLNITHTYVSDLDMSLIAPDGTTLILASAVGGSGNNFTGTCFRSDAPNSIIQGTPPFNGNFRPQGQLGLVNNGQDPNGIWTLRIVDTYPADAGTLLNWSIAFGNDPATVFALESSDLPLVLIQTLGQVIPDEPKITAWMGIIDNGQGVRNYPNDVPNNYNGFIGIELRGTSSLAFPQKQYSIETRTATGSNLNVSILGMPAENDWVLYAPYNDKSMMRNVLTYSLTRDMGRYASREKYCEVIINNEYKGVYTMFEKVKRDSNRVDIAKLKSTDTTGVELTGGYMCSLDWVDNQGWYSNYPPDPTNPSNNTVFYQYMYPQDTTMHITQKTYIQQFVDSFETALLSTSFSDPSVGWRKYGDEGSFIDYFLMNEISKNVDGYRLSTFFYKDKITQGGKINMGPVWDYNLAWHNANYCGNTSSTGWAYLFTNSCQWDFPFWWRRLNQDTTFKNNVRCRWNELRTTTFDTLHIFNYVDSIATLLNESQSRQYYIYPILGMYVWPNPNPIATTYLGEIANLKSWIRSRIIYMDNFLPGNCLTTGLSDNESKSKLNIWPNPSSDQIFISNWSQGAEHLKIYNSLGKIVRDLSIADSMRMDVDISNFTDGFYIVRVVYKNGQTESSGFIKN